MRWFFQSADGATLLRRARGLLLVAALAAGCAIQARADLTPSDVEAAYLYNFGKFVNWPPTQSSPAFTICTLGDDFGPTLESLVANERMQGQKIAARRLASIADAETCQIVFLGAGEESRLSRDLAALKGKPILTVSSLPGFLDRGGMIQFVIQNNRVRFAIGLANAEHTGLSLSSELLKVAAYVNPKSTGEAKP